MIVCKIYSTFAWVCDTIRETWLMTQKKLIELFSNVWINLYIYCIVRWTRLWFSGSVNDVETAINAAPSLAIAFWLWSSVKCHQWSQWTGTRGQGFQSKMVKLISQKRENLKGKPSLKILKYDKSLIRLDPTRPSSRPIDHLFHTTKRH